MAGRLGWTIACTVASLTFRNPPGTKPIQAIMTASTDISSFSRSVRSCSASFSGLPMAPKNTRRTIDSM
jgi:hypothetical protein